MAAADPPAGFMDIASTLSQDDIPFKLRCAICNNLAVNAFRLPCCDQSVCETCQASLSDSCPVCAHIPVSPDLCKPNKALRTTLKAFLRTEEKKREKERQAAAPPTPTVSEPPTIEQAPVEATAEQNTTESTPLDHSEVAVPLERKPDGVTTDALPAEDAPNGTAVKGVSELGEPEAEAEPTIDQAAKSLNAENAAKSAEGEASVNEPSGNAQAQSQTPGSGPTNMSGGGFPGMNWIGPGNPNAMNPYMANAMFNFANPMGMSMTMDPMAASQGMFGDSGMNMTGMGMNMGMNYNGQGMYGSLGWDASQQNMWHGGQDNFNPNAFANGTGPPYGGAFGGSSMSYPSNSGFQSGYYGPGYGRGGYRARGRGGFQGSGRGGFGGSSANPAFAGQHALEGSLIGVAVDGKDNTQTGEHDGTNQADGTTTTAVNDNQELHEIPTVDSLSQPMQMGPNDYQGSMNNGSGYGRGGFMRGPAGRGGIWNGPYQPHIEQPRGPGVEGAPAAPRAMRQGLPNTSVFRQRGGLHGHGKTASVSSNAPTPSQRAESEAAQEQGQRRPPSIAPSHPSRAVSRSRSPSKNRSSRDPEPAVPAKDGRNGHRDDEPTRAEGEYENDLKDRRSRSPSQVSSSRPSRHHHRERERDRRDGHRSHRSRRHRGRKESRSRSPLTNGNARHSKRFASITEDTSLNGDKAPSEADDSRDLTNGISNSRGSRDRHRRHDEEREERDRARDSRRRQKDRDRDHDHDRERERGRRDKARESEKDRRRDRDRERERDRGKGRGDRDRKRSRRDRSASTHTGEDSSRSQALRVKRDDGNDHTRDSDKPKAQTRSEPEKDPYSLEREARNRERMQREQQNRDGTKSSHSRSHRRDARQERLVGGRRIHYKYEDEL